MKKFILLFCALVIFSCTNDDSSSDDNNQIVNPNPLDPEVEENVVIILQDNSNLTSTQTDLDNGLYEFNFTGEVPEINNDDIIVGDEGEGFLRRVISSSVDGNLVSIQTTQATIDDVFKNVSIGFNTDISEDSRLAQPIKQKVVYNYLREGVSVNSNGLGFDFSNTELYNDGNASLTITNGNVLFDPNFVFNADYSVLTGLDYFEFKTDNTNLQINCDLDFTVAGSVSLPTFTETLASYDNFITFPVVGVPVVVVVSTEIIAELNASVDASTSILTSWTNSYELNTGIKYDNNTWSTNFDFNTALNINDVNFDGQLNLAQNLTITPRASLRFYGIVGPYCEPQLTEDFNFNVTTPSLDWDAEVKAGLNFTIGADVTVFGNTLADYANTQSYEQPIWNAPNTVIIESGNDQSGFGGQLLDESLKVKVVDSEENALPFIPVYFTTTGGGSLDEDVVVTDEDGFAEVFWTLGLENEQFLTAEVKKADGTFIDSTVTFEATIEEQNLEFSGDLNFGDVAVGETEQRTLTITNPYSAPIDIVSISLPNGFTADWLFGAILGNSSQNVNITFEPTEVQDYSGVIDILSSVNTDGDAIDVLGVGVEGEVDVFQVLVSGFTWEFSNGASGERYTYDYDGELINTSDDVVTYNGYFRFFEDGSIFTNATCGQSESYSIDGNNLSVSATASCTVDSTTTYSFSGTYDPNTGTFIGVLTVEVISYWPNGNLKSQFSGGSSCVFAD